jgi:hypothetical protein
LKLVDPLFLHFLFFFGGEEVGVALLSSEVGVALLSLEGGVVLLSLEGGATLLSSLSRRRRRPDKASSKIPFMVTTIRSLGAGTTTVADVEVEGTKKLLKASTLKFT